MDKLKDQKAYA